MKRFVLNREQKLKFVADCLAWLATQVQIRNAVCFYDVNHIAEDIYCDLLNPILDLNLANRNAIVVNSVAIDLVDSDNKVIVQVSSTRRKKKLTESLSHIDVGKFSGL